MFIKARYINLQLLPNVTRLNFGDTSQLAMQLLPVGNQIIKKAFCDPESRRKSVVLANGGEPPEQLCHFSLIDFGLAFMFGENPLDADGAIVAVRLMLNLLHGKILQSKYDCVFVWS